jgi:hypothetical protein
MNYKLNSTVKKTFFLLVSLLLFILLKSGRAEDIRFYISAPPQIGQGEQFRVTFTANANGSDFRGPGFKGFSVLSGPNQSSSSSVQFINGAMTQSVSFTYTYILQADKEGEYEVSPATITIQGKTYKTQPTKIKVVKGSAGQQARTNQRGQSSQGGSTPGGNANISSSDLFVKTIVNKSEAWQGEQIIVTQKIYSRVNLVGFEDIKYPSFSGFWSSEVKLPQQINLKKETYNGVVYNVAELKKTILFAQKSGSLVIDPITVTAVVQVRTQGRGRTGDPFFDNFFNDPFFGSSVQNVKKDVVSSPVTIRIKPLPDKDKPVDFNGSVGTFTVKASVDKKEVKANDAITYKVVVSGSGNLELIDKLNTQFPSDFEIYDPKTSSNISATAGGVNGSKSFEYLLIPRNPGKFEIGPVSLSFFDLAKKQYVTVNTEGFSINVGKGDGRSVSYSGVDKEEIKYLNSDIRYIKTRTPLLSPVGYTFYNTWVFWILVAVPPVLFIIVLLVWRRRIRLLSDETLRKSRKATKVASQRLKKAGEHLKKGNEDVFYIEISQALWGYLSHKLNIPVSHLSMESAREALAIHHIEDNLIQQYLDTIASCEFARFAPGEKEQKMDNLYQQAMQVITSTEKVIK